MGPLIGNGKFWEVKLINLDSLKTSTTAVSPRIVNIRDSLIFIHVVFVRLPFFNDRVRGFSVKVFR